MNFVKMAAGQNADTGAFIKIDAEAVTRGIVDEDSGVILYGEYGGYKVTLIGEVMDPAYLSGGTVADGIVDTDVAFSIVVEDPEGNRKIYAPGVKNSNAVWLVQS